MPTEIWKPVVGFEGFHEVSSHGRVRSVTSLDHLGRCWVGRIRKQHDHKRTKHKMVTLTGGGKRATVKVHQLALEAFVGPKPEGKMCCHFDGNPANNHVRNLRWDTAKGNGEDLRRHGTLLRATCAAGHPYVYWNTYVVPSNGNRQCRACNRAYAYASYHSKPYSQDLRDRFFDALSQERECGVASTAKQ